MDDQEFLDRAMIAAMNGECAALASNDRATALRKISEQDGITMELLISRLASLQAKALLAERARLMEKP